MPYTSPELRQQVAMRARYCCEYCQSAERITSGPMHIEHIVPIVKGLDQWQQHFTWSDDKTRILGFTATCRVTTTALNMNDPVIVMSRSLWVSFGLHPPQDEAPL